MAANNCLTLLLTLAMWSVLYTSEVRHIFKHAKHKYKRMKGEKFLNTWAVIVHGDENMASKVAAENGFVRKGKIFGDVYEFVHTGIPRRRERAAFKKTLHLTRDPRVVWAQQQVGKIRKKRSIYFNDARWNDQWYLHRSEDTKFKGHDMNVVPVWKQGITGKGVVVSILDDGIEYTHPELATNYDAKASYDFNSNDPDPIPRYTWRNDNRHKITKLRFWMGPMSSPMTSDADNRHGTRCAAEVAAVANNSMCIVGVAYGASIGGIRMLDGVVTDTIESKSLSYARDHIDIYSSSWGPDDDGMTVDGPGALTKAALDQGCRKGRKGRGNIFVWASGNGGNRRDNCNCDGYTNSIYTISVSAATSNGVQPWYLESCASTLVSAYSSGTAENNERHIVTADLRGYDLSGECTDTHTGTSVSAPLVAGFIALALEANPSLTWRDIQHLLVETSHLNHLIDLNDDFRYNGVGKRYSHHFGYGIVNGGKLVNLAKKWHTVGEQRKCHHRREIKKFPFTRFTKKSPLVLLINTTACKGTTQHIRYVEHVHVQVNLYHDKRGATEILIVSPMGTESWILKERPKDSQPGQFQDWLFLSSHFWGEDPVGVWTVKFMSKESDESKEGYLQDMTLILYGTHQKPGAKRKHVDNAPTPGYACHEQCTQGCSGPKNNQCTRCKKLYYVATGKLKLCVESCPSNMFSISGSKLCVPCHKSCTSCSGGNVTDCTSCPLTHGLSRGRCMEQCPAKMFKEEHPSHKNSFHCKKCAARCTSCVGHAENCSACDKGSILKGTTCYAKCSSSHWLDGEKCSKCHPTCKMCVGGKSTNCTKCKKKALNDLEDRFLYKGECAASCPLRTFNANTVMRDCTDCPGNCLKCSQDGRKCDICDVSFFMITSADGQCVKTCPDGYYADVVKRVCEPCDLHCKSCVPGNPSACTSCLDDYFLKAHECVVKSECQTRYYVNETTGKCDVCPPTCSFCQSAEFCTQCFLSYFLTPTNKCVAKCPVGTYAYRRDTCQKCASSCFECDGPTSRDCLSCAHDKYLLDGTCINNIPAGYYAIQTGRQKILERCHPHCTKCTGPKLKDCVQCIEKFDKREEGCVNPCPGQWLSDNKCDNCHPSCKACYGRYASQCLDCNNNRSLNVDTHSCSKGCHRKYYKDKKSYVCTPCHHSCASCFGPSASQCLTCPDKFQFHNFHCVWQCPAGWYKTFGGKCAPCSSRCKKCLYKYDLCTSCREDEVLIPGFKCAKSCGAHKFYDSSRRCYSCHESCLTCQSNAPNQCLSCTAGMTLFEGMCLPGCLTGLYNSTKEKKCTPCMNDCLKCKESVDHLTCKVCSNTTYLLPNGQCTKKCPPGFYQKLTENVCGVCPGKHCIDCQADQGKTCKTCKPLRAVSKGLCKSICGIGNYPNDTLKQCQKCHPLCFSCDGPTERDCIRCNAHAFKIKNSPNGGMRCVESCPAAYYNENKICKPCSKYCKECMSTKTCSLCEKDMVLFNNSCLSVCPLGFASDTKKNCIPCEKTFQRCSLCSVKICVLCKPGFYMKNEQCVSECGDSYARGDRVCIPCVSFDRECSRCTNLTCTHCGDGFIVNSTRCIPGCKDGFMMKNGSCEKCRNENCTEDVTTTFLPTSSSYSTVTTTTTTMTTTTTTGVIKKASTIPSDTVLDTTLTSTQNVRPNITTKSVNPPLNLTTKITQSTGTTTVANKTTTSRVSLTNETTLTTKSVTFTKRRINATQNIPLKNRTTATTQITTSKQEGALTKPNGTVKDGTTENTSSSVDVKDEATTATMPSVILKNKTTMPSTKIPRKIILYAEGNEVTINVISNTSFEIDTESLSKITNKTKTKEVKSNEEAVKILKSLEKNMTDLAEPNQSITVVPEKHPKRMRRSVESEDLIKHNEIDIYSVLLVAVISISLVLIVVAGVFANNKRHKRRTGDTNSY